MIDELAEQLDASNDPAEVRGLYLRIVEELAAHEAAEQEVVFPAFRAALGRSDDDTVAHRMGEHEEMNELLAEMRGLAPEGFAFTKRGSAFLLEVQGHFQREEESVFDRMRATLSADELAELGSPGAGGEAALPHASRRRVAPRHRSLTTPLIGDDLDQRRPLTAASPTVRTATIQLPRSAASTPAANPSRSATVGSCSHTSNDPSRSAYRSRWPGCTTARIGTSGLVTSWYRCRIARC